jgi:hypothetical protein
MYALLSLAFSLSLSLSLSFFSLSFIPLDAARSDSHFPDQSRKQQQRHTSQYSGGLTSQYRLHSLLGRDWARD